MLTFDKHDKIQVLAKFKKDSVDSVESHQESLIRVSYTSLTNWLLSSGYFGGWVAF